MTSIGKARGLSRLADENGHFRMVALDQRPPIFDVIAQARGVSRDEVRFEEVTAVKRLLVEALAPHCSSMLFDPNFAVPAAIDRLPARCGLIVTLEEHRVEETKGGRRSRAITDWSVEKIRTIGGDAVKVLAWYRPDAEAEVCAHQKRFVREIGDQCRRYDIPYVLELLVFPFLETLGHTPDYVESPNKLPELVIDSVREFAKPEYGVDLMKLESPLAANTLPAHDATIESKAAQKEFDAIGEICREATLPWVLLSGGAAPETFERVLQYAYAAGATGFLAGRTIWLDAMRSHYPDLAGVASALRVRSIGVLQNLNRVTSATAPTWSADFPGASTIRAEGDFTHSYQPSAA
jgi:tagatose 1,6-diphosphate aldolase